MNDNTATYIFGVLVCALVAAGALWRGDGRSLEWGFSEYRNDHTEVVALHVEEKGTTTPMLFVGDVMLARHVEKFMREKELGYPFSKITEQLKRYSAVVGNFEASIPAVHVPTVSMGFSFSVDEEIAGTLKDYGFTHMTLANNHALDFGVDDLLHTKEVLQGFGLGVGGSPERISLEESVVINADGLTVGVVPVFAVFETPDLASATSTLASLAETTDLQIIYIHWGDEYELTNTGLQQELAHAFIDAGADAVIGHHPHVVEGVELYNGAPIFYSLGNFIFDQYWNREVQTGLGVAVSRTPNAFRFEIIPVESTKSVPSFAEGDARTAILLSVAERSDISLQGAIDAGVIEVPFLSSEEALVSGPRQ